MAAGVGLIGLSWACSSARSSTSSSGACRGASRSCARRPPAPAAAAPIRPRDNVPVVSWLLLRGPLPRLPDADQPALPAGRAGTGRAVRRPGRCGSASTRCCRRTSTWRPSAWRSPSSTSTASACPTRSRCRRYPVALVLLGGGGAAGSDSGEPAARAARRARHVRPLLRAVLRLPGRHGLRRRQAAGRARPLPGWLGWGALGGRPVPRASCSAGCSARR